MKELDKTFYRENTYFEYTQIYKDNGVVVYEIKNSSGNVHWELWELKTAKAQTVKYPNKIVEYPAREVKPSNEDFGKWAWCFSNFESLRKKRKQVINRLKIKAKNKGVE